MSSKGIAAFVFCMMLGLGLFTLRSKFFPLPSPPPKIVVPEADLSIPDALGNRSCPADLAAQIARIPANNSPMTCMPASFPIDGDVGPIHGKSSMKDIEKACGAVASDILSEIGGGSCQWESVFYFGSDHEMRLSWKDWKTKQTPDTLRFLGTALKFSNGLAVGMNLNDIEKLNGKPLQLNEFSSDGIASQASFQGGALKGFDGTAEKSSSYYLRFKRDSDVVTLKSVDFHFPKR